MEEAWPTLLEEKVGRGVLNFGVARYGTDQVLLRLEKEYDRVPSATVLLCIMTENINRCVMLYRGFYHAGFGLPKPRFVLKDDELELYNPFATADAVRDILLEHPDRLASMAREHDHWFREKQLFGTVWRLRFPYSVQLAGRVPFLLSRVRIRMTNISPHVKLYEPEAEAFKIMQGIVRRFRAFADQRGFRGLVVILPAPRDVYRLAEKGEVTYQVLHEFLAAEGIPFVDVIGPFSKQEDIPSLFFSRKDHYNRKGNEIVAHEVSRFLREEGAVPGG